MTRICHLVDDTSPGGVTRFLEHMSTAPEHAILGEQLVVPVRTGLSRPPKVEVDVIVSHVVLSWKNLPFLFALRARHPGVPIVHMEHSYSPAFEQLHVDSVRRFHTMLSVSLSLFDRVVLISDAQRDWLLGAGILDAGKIAMIPPHVDVSEFTALKPVNPTIRSIGAFGRFDSQKGFDVLIPAFRMSALGDVTLHIFGDGPDRAKLEGFAGDDKRIIFHGFVDDPAAAMAKVDAVVMPSRREPYGLVALEALAAGRTLLVSRVDGLLDHAKNGAIPVARLTRDDWARALETLNETTTQESRARAKSLATESGKQFVERWKGLLNDLTR